MSKDDIRPGEQLTLAQINRIRKQQHASKSRAGNGAGSDRANQRDAGDGDSTSRPSDGLKVEELRAALEERGIEIPEGAKKADLQQLLDEADQGAGEDE